jgi:hypothetical protein
MVTSEELISKEQLKNKNVGTCQVQLNLITSRDNHMTISLHNIPEKQGLCLIAICNAIDNAVKDKTYENILETLYNIFKEKGLI